MNIVKRVVLIPHRYWYHNGVKMSYFLMKTSLRNEQIDKLKIRFLKKEIKRLESLPFSPDDLINTLTNDLISIRNQLKK